MHKSLSFLALMFVGFVGVHAAKADTCGIVTNCGFETGDFTGWTGSYVTLSGTPPLPNAQAGVDASDPYAGTYEAYLASYGSNSTLSQTLATTSGQLYTISFYLDNTTSPSLNYTNDFSASFGGLTLISETAALASTYTLYTFAGAATSNSTLLSFTARNDSGYFDLDSVSVVGSTTATVTPEPSSLILLGTGLIGLVGAARRRILS